MVVLMVPSFHRNHNQGTNDNKLFIVFQVKRYNIEKMAKKIFKLFEKLQSALSNF